MICLSLATIFILIVATVTIVTIISKTPIIVLALGQAQAGQMDFTIAPKYFVTVNNTRIKELTKQDSMARVELEGTGVNDIFGTGWLMDFEAENRNRLGHFGFDIAGNEVFLHEAFGFKVGEWVDVEVPAYGVSIGNVAEYLEQKGPPANMSRDVLTATLATFRNLWKFVGKFRVAGTFATS